VRAYQERILASGVGALYPPSCRCELQQLLKTRCNSQRSKMVEEDDACKIMYLAIGVGGALSAVLPLRIAAIAKNAMRFAAKQDGGGR